MYTRFILSTKTQFYTTTYIHNVVILLRKVLNEIMIFEWRFKKKAIGQRNCLLGCAFFFANSNWQNGTKYSDKMQGYIYFERSYNDSSMTVIECSLMERNNLVFLLKVFHHKVAKLYHTRYTLYIVYISFLFFSVSQESKCVWENDDQCAWNPSFILFSISFKK